MFFYNIKEIEVSALSTCVFKANNYTFKLISITAT